MLNPLGFLIVRGLSELEGFAESRAVAALHQGTLKPSDTRVLCWNRQQSGLLEVGV